MTVSFKTVMKNKTLGGFIEEEKEDKRGASKCKE
jgi:hypothetical protein